MQLKTSALLACSKTPVAPVAQVSDSDITEHVTTALQQSTLLHGMNITVVTLKGDVRLTGVVDRQAQVDEALRIARAAEGVHTLHDELTVKAASAP
jgi:hyperosmotically inducible protein